MPNAKLNADRGGGLQNCPAAITNVTTPAAAVRMLLILLMLLLLLYAILYIQHLRESWASGGVIITRSICIGYRIIRW